MTVSEMIDALGGTNVVAETLGVVPSAVRNWRAAGVFPASLYPKIAELAAARKVEVDPALFRWRGSAA